MASITDYLQVGGVQAKNFIVFNTSRPVGDDIEPILEGKKLTNGFTLETFNLPLEDDVKAFKYGNILNRFKLVLPILRDGRNSATGQIVYLMSIFLPYLHPYIAKAFTRFNSIGTTLGITNIPFADYCKIGQNNIKDMFSFINNFEDTKFYLVMFTYEDRLETTLVTKKDLNISREELQIVLNNTFLNISNLYEEVKLNEAK